MISLVISERLTYEKPKASGASSNGSESKNSDVEEAFWSDDMFVKCAFSSSAENAGYMMSRFARETKMVKLLPKLLPKLL